MNWPHVTKHGRFEAGTYKVTTGAFRLAILALGLAGLASAERKFYSPPKEPDITSVFPLGGQQATTFQVEVRGVGLDEVYAVWFQCSDVSATIRRVEKALPGEVGEQPEKKDSYADREAKYDHRVWMEVTVERNAAVGLHAFRLVTSRGASNALAIQVVSEPVVTETEVPHSSASHAQPVGFPTVINGQIREKGELDFYSFDVAAGQELLFQAFSRFKMDVSYRAQVELTLYELAGSWFDPSVAIPLTLDKPILSWETIDKFRLRDFAATFVLYPGLSYRFKKKGKYLASVGSFMGRGGPDYSYQFRIIPAPQLMDSQTKRWAIGELAHRDSGDWLERDSATQRQFGSFIRRIEPDRLLALGARSVIVPPQTGEGALREQPLVSGTAVGGSAKLAAPFQAPASELTSSIPSRQETEPNDQLTQAEEIPVPIVLEGRIQHASDVDIFRFKVNSGQRLAFEIETPQAAPPRFNPWLKVLGSDGQEVVANIYKEYGGDGDDVNKTLERKTVYTFATAGDYYLQIRDLTTRLGEAEFFYRILIRPQVPHVGRIEVSLGVKTQGSQLVDITDRLNLTPDSSREFTVLCEKEEGFEGKIALTIENLPSGVRALPSSPASWTEALLRGMQYRPVGVDVMPPDWHRPKREVLTIMLVAGEDALPTPLPRLLRISARPILEGRMGPVLPVAEIPFMLIKPTEVASDPVKLSQ